MPFDPGAAGGPPRHLQQLDLVRIPYSQVGILLGQRLDRLAARIRAEQHLSDLHPRPLIHDAPFPNSKLYALYRTRPPQTRPPQTSWTVTDAMTPVAVHDNDFGEQRAGPRGVPRAVCTAGAAPARGRGRVRP